MCTPFTFPLNEALPVRSAASWPRDRRATAPDRRAAVLLAVGAWLAAVAGFVATAVRLRRASSVFPSNAERATSCSSATWPSAVRAGADVAVRASQASASLASSGSFVGKVRRADADQLDFMNLAPPLRRLGREHRPSLRNPSRSNRAQVPLVARRVRQPGDGRHGCRSEPHEIHGVARSARDPAGPRSPRACRPR